MTTARQRAERVPARAPRRVSPGVLAARRALLVDSIVALAIAAVVIALAAGIGVVGFFGLLALLALAIWFGAEAAIRRARRGRGPRRARQRRAAGARR